MTTNGTAALATAVAERPTVATAMVRHAPQSIEPTSMRELEALAKHAADSRFFGAANPSQAILIMMAGKDLGLSYTQALRAFHVIEGRPALSADGMVAVCLAHKEVCEYFRVVDSSGERATVETKRVGDPARKMTFSIEEARTAGLVKAGSGWAKWPGRMCLARAKSFLARETYPDLLMGLYDDDELRDSVKATMKRVTYDVTTGEVDDGADQTNAAAAKLEAAIRAAETLPELRAAALAVSKASKAEEITKEQRDLLAAIGTERKGQITPVVEVVQAREPGEEG